MLTSSGGLPSGLPGGGGTGGRPPGGDPRLGPPPSGGLGGSPLADAFSIASIPALNAGISAVSSMCPSLIAILGPFLTADIGSLLLSPMVLLLDGGVLGLPICLDAGASDALRRFEFPVADFGADAPDVFVVELVSPLGGELAVDPTNANDAVSLADVDASSSLKFWMIFSDFLFIGTMGN